MICTKSPGKIEKVKSFKNRIVKNNSDIRCELIALINSATLLYGGDSFSVNFKFGDNTND